MRDDVVGRERSGTVRVPPFPFQTVHAPELELVPKPRFVAGILGIALRPVPPRVRFGRVIEDAGRHS